MLLPSLARPATASPQSKSDPREDRIRALEADLVRVRKEIARLHEEIEALRSQARAARESSATAARLETIEAHQVKLEAELARLADDLKHTGDALDQASEADRKRPTVTVYGTLQASAYHGTNSLLDAEAFEMVLSGRPHQRLSFFAEIEFERAAAVGAERGGEVVLEQAYASYAFAALLTLRAGVLLVPFGNVNVDHFAPLRDVVGKPLVSYAIAPSDWTDNGIQISGRHLIGASWLVNYEACVVAGLDANFDSVGLRGARQGFGVDNNGNKALAGRLSVHRGSTFELGGSTYTGKYDDAGTRRLTGYAIDSRVEVGTLRLTGEYDHFVADRGRERNARFQGYYVRASYDLRGRALRAIAKDFDDPRLTLVVQYDWVRIEGPGPASGAFEANREERLTAGIAYRPSRQWVLKVNYERNTASSRPLDRGNLDGWLGSIGFVF